MYRANSDTCLLRNGAPKCDWYGLPTPWQARVLRLTVSGLLKHVGCGTYLRSRIRSL